MMPPREIQENILFIINDPDIWQELSIYLNWKIAKLRELNDTAVGENLYKNQGAIKELKELMDLKVRMQTEHNKNKPIVVAKV